MRTMTSPFLRIVLALVIGLWSPLCCCQAAMVAGALTGTPGDCTGSNKKTAASPIKVGCCDHCGDEPSNPGSSDHSSSTNHDRSPGDRSPCNDCPGCQGTLGLSRLDKADTAMQALALAMAVLVIVVPVDLPLTLPTVTLPFWPRLPDHLPLYAGGRSLLRWHCALVV